MFRVTTAAHPSFFQARSLYHFGDASVTATQSSFIIIFAYVFIFILVHFTLVPCCFLIYMYIFNSAVQPV